MFCVCVCISETPRFAASGGVDNMCCIHDLSGVSGSGALSRSVTVRELSAHDGYLSCCRFLGDERRVLTSSVRECPPGLFVTLRALFVRGVWGVV